MSDKEVSPVTEILLLAAFAVVVIISGFLN